MCVRVCVCVDSDFVCMHVCMHDGWMNILFLVLDCVAGVKQDRHPSLGKHHSYSICIHDKDSVTDTATDAMATSNQPRTLH